MNSFLRGLVGWHGVEEIGWEKVQDLATEDFIKASNSCDDVYADLATLVQILDKNEESLAKLTFKIGPDSTNVTLVCA